MYINVFLPGYDNSGGPLRWYIHICIWRRLQRQISVFSATLLHVSCGSNTSNCCHEAGSLPPSPPDHEYSSNQNSEVTLLCCWISPWLLPGSIHMGYTSSNICLFLPSIPPCRSVDISFLHFLPFSSHIRRPPPNTLFGFFQVRSLLQWVCVCVCVCVCRCVYFGCLSSDE